MRVNDGDVTAPTLDPVSEGKVCPRCGRDGGRANVLAPGRQPLHAGPRFQLDVTRRNRHDSSTGQDDGVSNAPLTTADHLGAHMTAVLPERTDTTERDESSRAERDESIRTARAERLALMAEHRAAERTRELIDLQLTRPELVGAYAPADFAASAVRWAV